MRKSGTARVVAAILLCVMLCASFCGCSAHVHTFADGSCTECGAACEHAFGNGVCAACGYKCPHAFYVDGACEVCGRQCDHRFVTGVCVVCGIDCVHDYFDDGVCLGCGKQCEHDFELGVCKACGEVCRHEYVKGVCKICAYVCMHNYIDGICVDCGAACAHKYTDGVCSVCNVECAHNTYSDGRCVECGKQCEHTKYSGRVCVTCGMIKAAHYDYTAVYAANMPRINICTVNSEDASKLMTTESMNFDAQPGSKDNRPYYGCTVTVDNCATEHALDGIQAEVKIRGNYTANYPKKPFRIKFNKKQSMLGLNGGQKFKSWVLLADYKDISMTRNALTFYLGKQILGGDGYYSTDFLPVELYLNDQYWGVYLLAEQQQVNSGRVDVTEPDDGYKGTDIGYMIEYDGYYGLETYAERFSCDYYGGKPLKVRNGGYVYPPDVGFSIKNDVYFDDENTCAQKHFIKSYVANLYKLCYEAVYNHNYLAFNADKTALVQYSPKTSAPVRETIERVIDVRSLVDVYILNEIACDADIAWSSFFMDVDFGATGDGIMRFEAPWDFDSALGLKDTCASGEGLFAANSNNPWLVIFINESWFQNEIKLKWREMNDAQVMEKALRFVRRGREKYAQNYERNFEKWGFVKSGELNGTAMQLENHAEAVEHLYNWFDTRVKYLDSLWL